MEEKKDKKIKKWFYDNADSKLSQRVLGIVAFTDGFISPLPPDPFLALMTALRPKKWLYFTLFTIILSVLGGVVGYLIGLTFYQNLGSQLFNIYDLNENLQNIANLFQEQAFLSIFLAALTPIPYQIFTVAGGIFKINFVVFVVASILGRGIRYFAVALIMKFIGERYGHLILKYLNRLLLLTAIVIFAYLIYKSLF